MNNFLERLFHLREQKTTVRTELMAGLATFTTMAYIIFVNPTILREAGMDFGAAMVATVITTVVATLIMGLYANYPFAIAPGMGLNAYFAYVMVLGQGASWQQALGAVFVSGLLFALLNLCGIRQLIVAALPRGLRIATAAGIGLFLAFIGLQSVGIIIATPETFVTLGDVTHSSSFLTLFGVIIITALMLRRVPGAILIGCLLNWLISLCIGKAAWQGIISWPPSPLPLMGSLDIVGVLNTGFLAVILSLLFVSLIETSGSLIGLAEQGQFLDKHGELPRSSRAFMSDADGGMIGALIGTSPVTIYLESGAGIASGGRTGLTAVAVAGLFLVSLFFEPLAASIPPFATASTLIVIGALMMKPLAKIAWEDPAELIPAFLILITIPLTYSIFSGIALGFITYPCIMLLAGRAKNVSWLAWALAILFILKFIFLP